MPVPGAMTPGRHRRWPGAGAAIALCALLFALLPDPLAASAAAGALSAETSETHSAVCGDFDGDFEDDHTGPGTGAEYATDQGSTFTPVTTDPSRTPPAPCCANRARAPPGH